MQINNYKQNDSLLEPEMYYGSFVHILDLHREFPSSPEHEHIPKKMGMIVCRTKHSRQRVLVSPRPHSRNEG
jgi:hypothetical protein